MTAYPGDEQEMNTKAEDNEEEEIHNGEEYIISVGKTNDEEEKLDEQGAKKCKIETEGESIKNEEQSK